MDLKLPDSKFLTDWLYSTRYISDPDRIRTYDPQLRRLLLYPTELRDQMRRGRDSNPRVVRPAVFKTAVINQTLPPLRGLIYYFKEQKKTETFKGPGFI